MMNPSKPNKIKESHNFFWYLSKKESKWKKISRKPAHFVF